MEIVRVKTSLGIVLLNTLTSSCPLNRFQNQQKKKSGARGLDSSSGGTGTCAYEHEDHDEKDRFIGEQREIHGIESAGPGETA